MVSQVNQSIGAMACSRCSGLLVGVVVLASGVHALERLLGALLSLFHDLALALAFLASLD